jgi:hypothetical protein
MYKMYPTGRKLSARSVEQRAEHKAAFPNQISDGSFTPHSTLIELDTFNLRTFFENQAAQSQMHIRQKLQVLSHETTHWFDFFGTRWGRSYIEHICQGFRGLETANETGFAAVLALFDIDRKVLAPEYYRHTREPVVKHSNDTPWKTETVTGVEIDANGRLQEDRPLLMVRFYDVSKNENFARQPLSVGALLEARAIASEIQTAEACIASHPDPSERLVERKLVEKELNEILYHHDRIEYNVAVHLLRQQAGIKDPVQCYKISSTLAFISLNLAPEDFHNLRPPQIFNFWGERNNAFKRNNDHGYAFACMVYNGGKFADDGVDYVERCLSACNLGAVNDIMDRAEDALFAALPFSASNAAVGHFLRESGKGTEIMQVFRTLPYYSLSHDTLFEKLRTVCPPILDASGEFFELNKGRIDEYNPEDMHDAAHKLREYTRNLLNGARGV